MNNFIAFAQNILMNKTFITSAYSLLPFDKSINTSIDLNNNKSLVKNLGITLMRMDIEPDLFSFGLSITISGSKYSIGENATILISAGVSFDKICESINSTEFVNYAYTLFSQQIDDCFSTIQLKELINIT
ncbi:MAG: hypothetical protein LKF31_03000 [Muribaculaceae bacterium]|nr:hypothetical protein [Muribaculaceae bacterium]